MEREKKRKSVCVWKRKKGRLDGRKKEKKEEEREEGEKEYLLRPKVESS